jgi:hypothetical protein
MFRVWTLFCFIAVAAVPGFAARPVTEIRVEVVDPKGKPVERASVILDFLTAHRQVFKLGKREAKHWEMRTNLQGVAKFPTIPQGTIRVQVIANGFQTFGENVDVDEPEKTVKVNLLAPQKQYSVYGPGSDSSQHQGPKEKKN